MRLRELHLSSVSNHQFLHTLMLSKECSDFLSSGSRTSLLLVNMLSVPSTLARMGEFTAVVSLNATRSALYSGHSLIISHELITVIASVAIVVINTFCVALLSFRHYDLPITLQSPMDVYTNPALSEYNLDNVRKLKGQILLLMVSSISLRFVELE